MSCRIEPNTELERGAAGEQPPSSLEETDSFSEQGKHHQALRKLLENNHHQALRKLTLSLNKASTDA
jgi:hypothetical protein